MQRLQDKVALITGGGRGIGRATALTFAKQGARVVIATRTASAGAEVVAEIEAGGGQALLVPIEILSEQDAAFVVEQAVQGFGQLDILLHNAAYIPFGALDALPPAELSKMFDVGLQACFWLTAAALPHLRKSRAGRVLVTSSLAGNRRFFPHLVHYCALKAGVNGFVKAAALELAPEGITVNGVEPGLILGHALQQSASPQVLAEKAAGIPMGRIGDPQDIAEAFLYLASESARYVTGVTIPVDGGISLGQAAPLTFDRLSHG